MHARAWSSDRRKDQGLDKPVEGIRVSQAVQEPEYYLSHYFGQPVGDILQCVRHHLRTRHFSDDTPYWIWAYAHRYGQDDVLPDRIYSSPAWQVPWLRQRTTGQLSQGER